MKIALRACSEINLDLKWIRAWPKSGLSFSHGGMYLATRQDHFVIHDAFDVKGKSFNSSKNFRPVIYGYVSLGYVRLEIFYQCV